MPVSQDQGATLSWCYDMEDMSPSVVARVTIKPVATDSMGPDLGGESITDSQKAVGLDRLVGSSSRVAQFHRHTADQINDGDEGAAIASPLTNLDPPSIAP